MQICEKNFQIKDRDRHTSARCGVLYLPHGNVNTPAFMPVGTVGTIKGITPDELRETGAEVLISNTYHLYIRGLVDTIKSMGGLNRFTGWDGPFFTDSGGFQIYSLAKLRRVTDDGIEFHSHIDGSRHFFTPELSIEIQKALMPDVGMVLDDLPPADAPVEEVERSVKRTTLWAERCKRSLRGENFILWGIIQGGTYPELRRRSADEIVSLDFPGYAVGGLSVGEPLKTRFEILEFTTPLLPDEKPRYLMGVGKPQEIVRAVSLGIDLFDCVIPTRNARNGTLYTSGGKILIKSTRYERDASPLDPQCGCPVCRKFTKAFLRYIFHANELLSYRLNTLHNLYFFFSLMKEIRKAILEKRYREFMERFFETYPLEEEEKDEGSFAE